MTDDRGTGESHSPEAGAQAPRPRVSVMLAIGAVLIASIAGAFALFGGPGGAPLATEIAGVEDLSTVSSSPEGSPDSDANPVQGSADREEAPTSADGGATPSTTLSGTTSVGSPSVEDESTFVTLPPLVPIPRTGRQPVPTTTTTTSPSTTTTTTTTLSTTTTTTTPSTTTTTQPPPPPSTTTTTLPQPPPPPSTTTTTLPQPPPPPSTTTTTLPQPPPAP